jgi:hypothetical protein
MAFIATRRAISTSSELEDHSIEQSRPSIVLGLVGGVVVANVLSTVLSLMV